MGGPKGPMCVWAAVAPDFMRTSRRPPPAARRPPPAHLGPPPLKAKKCASAAGNAWAFDFARIDI